MKEQHAAASSPSSGVDPTRSRPDEEKERLEPGAVGSTTVAVLAYFFDAWDSFLLIYCYSYISHSFHISLGEVALSLPISYAFRWLGGMLFGGLAARRGRRAALAGAVIVYGAATMLTGLAPTYLIFLFCRMLFGLGMGGAYAAGSSLVVESVTKRIRGVGSGIYSLGFYAGTAIAPIVFVALEPSIGWRGLFLAGGVSLFLVPAILLLVPESPVWLKYQENTPKPSLLTGLRIFLPGLLPLTLTLFALDIGSAVEGYPFASLLPTFLKLHRAFPLGIIALAGSLYGFGEMGGSVIGGVFSDLVGRRKMFLTSFLLSIIPTAVALFDPLPAVVVIGATLSGFLITLGGGQINVVEVESYSTSLRSAGNGIIHNIASLSGTGLGALVVVLEGGGIGLAVLIFGLTILGAILGVIGVACARETRGVALDAVVVSHASEGGSQGLSEVDGVLAVGEEV